MKKYNFRLLDFPFIFRI